MPGVEVDRLFWRHYRIYPYLPHCEPLKDIMGSLSGDLRW